jgi:phosphoribosylglycinamide formyltransferase-1
MPSTRIAIFASGAGSNAQKIIDHFKGDSSVMVELIVCNKNGAGVLTIAQNENIPFIMLEKSRFLEGGEYLHLLQEKKIDFLILAGFLWKLPLALIKAFPGRIMNIHPALLPKFGGKGMFGMKVHQAVIDAREKESGITIHYVDELYDHGRIIMQAKCLIDEGETPQTLCEKVHGLEHTHFAKSIALIIKLQNIVKT